MGLGFGDDLLGLEPRLAHDLGLIDHAGGFGPHLVHQLLRLLHLGGHELFTVAQCPAGGAAHRPGHDGRRDCVVVAFPMTAPGNPYESACRRNIAHE